MCIWYVHIEESIKRPVLPLDNEITREWFLFG